MSWYNPLTWFSKDEKKDPNWCPTCEEIHDEPIFSDQDWYSDESLEQVNEYEDLDEEDLDEEGSEGFSLETVLQMAYHNFGPSSSAYDKIKAIKYVREMTGLGLKEAKWQVDDFFGGMPHDPS